MITRKEVLKILSTIPLGGVAAAKLGPAFASDSRSSRNPSDGLSIGSDLFRSIGVEPIINCRGTFTIIGGSIEHPLVKEAMRAASNDFIQYDELAEGIGTRLAELTGAEWGMVSAGCAAGLKHVTAACVSGGNPEKLIRIPDLTGLDKTEVIMPRHSRTIYDHAIRNVGVEIVMVDTPEELQNAMSSKTAMICLMGGRTGPLGLKNIARMARPKGIPVLVDAAAEDLTIPNVHLRDGATVVAYSGGKALCGPQCSGLVIGDEKILRSAWQASSPHHGPGRDNKVGREEMIGLLAAVEAWVSRNHDEEWDTWLSWLDTISSGVSGIETIQTEVEEPEGLNNRTPRLYVHWDPDRLNVDGEQIAEELGRNKPRIALGSRNRDGRSGVVITTGQMQPGDAEVVAERLREVLSRSWQPEAEMSAPGQDLTGRWNVVVDFYNSSSEHLFFVEKQDGNWIQGSHKGDYSTRDMAGVIEGNEVKLVSVDRKPGNYINYIFTGQVSGDQLTGNLFMGEYLNATFSANRHLYPDERRKITVPGGPPLAT